MILSYLIIVLILETQLTSQQKSTQDPISPLQNFIVGCGYEKECIHLSLNRSRCSACNVTANDCDVLATWRSNVSRDVAYFELYTAVESMDYVALGVSTNEVMGSSDVFACQLDISGRVVVKDTWNTVGADSVNLLDPTQEGIQMIDWSYKDGAIYCKFSRDAKGRGYTDLNLFQEQFHILTAVGKGKDLNIGHGVGYHTEKCYTPSLYSISHEITSGCATTKECIILKDVNSCEPCSGVDCKFAITWAKDDTGSKVIFEIESKYPDLDYAAIGVSQNELMGDSDVFACQLSVTGGVVVKDTFNTVGISSQNVLATTQEAIEMIDSSFSNGVLYCKFSRNVRPSGDNGFNLFGETFNFIFAVGKGKNNGFRKGVGYHTEKCATFSKFDLDTEFSTPIDITAGCRETKQCLFIGAINNTCEPCLFENCELIATWQYDAPTNSIVFEMELQHSSVRQMSVAISNGDVVNGSEVYTCQVDGIDGIKVDAVYVPVNSSHTDNTTLQKVQLISGRIGEHSLYCKFERSVEVREDGFNLLTDPFYMSFKTEFQDTRQTGDYSVYERCETTDAFFLKTTDTEQQVDFGHLCEQNHCLSYSDIESCEQDSQCLKNDSCQFIIGWSYPSNKEQVRFYLRIDLTGMGWAAIGFSNDTHMGHDDVLGCQLTTQGGFVAKDTWNPDGYSPNQLDKNQNGIKLVSGYYMDNIMTCVFTRSTKPPYDTHGYNLLDRAYYLFSAVGRGLDSEAEDTGIPIHTYKCISSEEIKLDAGNHIVPGVVTGFNGFVMVHGIAMLFVWLIVFAVGIYMARVSREFFGKKLWMKIHGSINVFGVVVAVLGVISAIIGVKGWFVTPGDSKIIFHQTFGITMLAGISINPILAIFRHRNKKLFKLIHIAIGVSMETLAIINMAIGLSIYYNSNSTRYGLILYLVLIVPLWIVMQIVYGVRTVKKSRDTKKEQSIVAELEDSLQTNLISSDIWTNVNEEGNEVRKEPLLYKIKYKPKTALSQGIKFTIGAGYWLVMVTTFIVISILILSQK